VAHVIGHGVNHALEGHRVPPGLPVLDSEPVNIGQEKLGEFGEVEPIF
jgi:hypothetical protein